MEELFFKSRDTLSSYSDALESRARDRMEVLIREIQETGISDEYAKTFLNVKIQIGENTFRALDTSELKVNMTRVVVIPHSPEYTGLLLTALQEQEIFKNIKLNRDEGTLEMRLPRMSLDKKIELNDYVGQKYKNFEKSLMHVKGQTGQQIKAGIDNEFIFATDAAQASKEIEIIIQHYIRICKTITLLKQKKILGRDFTAENEEDAKTLKSAAALSGYIEPSG